jgi:hypothetical protein
MKKNAIFAFIVGGLFFATSCSSDDDSNPSTTNPSTTDVINTVSSGTWRITSYLDSGQDETADFAGYNFTFGASNVLTATNGTNNYSGIWSVTNDDDSANDLDFDILFSAPAPASFQDLSDDWDVVERTETKVRLRDVSGGNGDTDYLTFEKN